MSRAFTLHNLALDSRIAPYTDNLKVLQTKNKLLRNMTTDTLSHFKGVQPKVETRPVTTLMRARTAALPLTKLA